MQSGIHLGMGQRERLALFSRKELLKLITVDFDEVCKFLKQLSTLGEGCRAPQFECRSRMLDGSVKVFFSRYGNFVKGLAGGWINAMTSLRRRDKYIVDDVSFVGLSIVRLVLPRVQAVSVAHFNVKFQSHLGYCLEDIKASSRCCYSVSTLSRSKGNGMKGYVPDSMTGSMVEREWG